MGCSDTTEPPPVEDGYIDDRPEVPPKPADALEYIMPEFTVEGGSEIQMCVYLEPLTKDLYFSKLESYQGKYGHHAILFRTVGVVLSGRGAR